MVHLSVMWDVIILYKSLESVLTDNICHFFQPHSLPVVEVFSNIGQKMNIFLKLDSTQTEKLSN